MPERHWSIGFTPESDVGPQECSSTAPVATGAHPSATAQMKEVWVLKLDLEGALAKDREVEDFPLIREDAKGMGSLPCSPGSDLVTNKDQPSIVGGRQTLNLVERGASALRLCCACVGVLALLDNTLARGEEDEGMAPQMRIGVCIQVTRPEYSPESTCDVMRSSNVGPSF
ncbi:hypothetical protein B296_00037791 [Ensete ventricosum]|uniref:Uncharacterized protein n=1 Tax=Ensete ventricosum TaxID=4639 RepID=A0A426X7G1_ENSVE|nr:hypothetical protein B296_00037791 [Ensete ventricosum]